jgi:hypothetical protein
MDAPTLADFRALSGKVDALNNTVRNLLDAKPDVTPTKRSASPLIYQGEDKEIEGQWFISGETELKRNTKEPFSPNLSCKVNQLLTDKYRVDGMNYWEQNHNDDIQDWNKARKKDKSRYGKWRYPTDTNSSNDEVPASAVKAGVEEQGVLKKENEELKAKMKELEALKKENEEQKKQLREQQKNLEEKDRAMRDLAVELSMFKIENRELKVRVGEPVPDFTESQEEELVVELNEVFVEEKKEEEEGEGTEKQKTEEEDEEKGTEKQKTEEKEEKEKEKEKEEEKEKKGTEKEEEQEEEKEKEKEEEQKKDTVEATEETAEESTDEEDSDDPFGDIGMGSDSDNEGYDEDEFNEEFFS